MYIQHFITSTILLASMLQLSLGLFFPEASPKIDGFPYCHTENAGTCTVAYIVKPSGDRPVEVQILDNLCKKSIAHQSDLGIESSVLSLVTDPKLTSPTTKISVIYLSPKEKPQVEVLAQGSVKNKKPLSWNISDVGDLKVLTAPFDCHLKPDYLTISTRSTITPRQEGYPYCSKEPAGTCTLAYVIDYKNANPLSVLIHDNNCDDAMGGARHVAIDKPPGDFESDSYQTNPTTKIRMKYDANEEPAAHAWADDIELKWKPWTLNTKDYKAWTAPFNCHMGRR